MQNMRLHPASFGGTELQSPKHPHSSSREVAQQRLVMSLALAAQRLRGRRDAAGARAGEERGDVAQGDVYERRVPVGEIGRGSTGIQRTIGTVGGVCQAISCATNARLDLICSAQP